MGKSKKKRPDGGLLWRVSLPDGPAASYVFGTMHTRDARVHGFIPGLRPLLQECRVLATEFPLEDQHMPSLPAHLPHDDWWAALSRRKKRLVTGLLEKQGLGTPEAYQAFPPLVLMQLVAASLLGDEADHPLDLALAMEAKAQGLQLSGVETFAEQVAILENIPVRTQTKQLLDLVSGFASFRKRLKKQVRWYLDQDIRQLYRDARHQLKAMRKPMLLERNQRMAARMDLMAREAPHFFAVGAAHLSGGKGVLRLLKKRGFQLEPLSLSRHDA